MELLVLITVMLLSFGIALGMMKAALQMLLHSMTTSAQPVAPRFEGRPAHAHARRLEQLAA